MEKKRCAACRKHFHPRPQSPGQKFYSAAQCQRERKRRWQKARRAADPDYRDNDVQANRDWRSRHPGYWRAYRSKHPQSVICNRDKQRERDRARRLKPPQPSPPPVLANEGTDQNLLIYLYRCIEHSPEPRAQGSRRPGRVIGTGRQ